MIYLSPEAEERLAGGVHEDYLPLASRRVVIYSGGEVALRVEDREPVPVEEQRLPPDRQHHRLWHSTSTAASAGELRPRGGLGGGGVRVYLRHSSRITFSGRRKLGEETTRALFYLPSSGDGGERGPKVSIFITQMDESTPRKDRNYLDTCGADGRWG